MQAVPRAAREFEDAVRRGRGSTEPRHARGG